MTEYHSIIEYHISKCHHYGIHRYNLSLCYTNKKGTKDSIYEGKEETEHSPAKELISSLINILVCYNHINKSRSNKASYKKQNHCKYKHKYYTLLNYNSYIRVSALSISSSYKNL